MLGGLPGAKRFQLAAAGLAQLCLQYPCKVLSPSKVLNLFLKICNQILTPPTAMTAPGATFYQEDQLTPVMDPLVNVRGSEVNAPAYVRKRRE